MEGNIMTKFIWIEDFTKYPDYYIQVFGHKEITKALEICVHHTDCDEWMLAVQNGMILGFSGYNKSGDVFILKRSYVMPEYRNIGLYKIMIDKRIEKGIKDGFKIFQATTTPMSRNELLKRGFFSIKQYKKIQTLRMLL
jgi:hypothetical protein